nr:hypothetical protein [uncultured Nocardioides sp.]
MTTSPTTQQGYTDDNRKHLEFLQAAITRMAQASATAKGWTLTVAGAGFSFSSYQRTWYVALITAAVLGAFSLLDCYYLRQERQFRDLYNAARRHQVDTFTMDTTPYHASHTTTRTYMSISILGFYLPLLVVGAIVVTLALT